MQLTDVDIYNPDIYVPGVPHEMFATLRREAPVTYIEHDGTGSWTVTKHDDIVTVNRDAKTFSSWVGTALLPEMPQEHLEQQRMMMLNLDPPEHTKLRLIVNKAFTPRQIQALMGRLREITRDILANVAERGECDFVVDVAAELPLQAIAELIGVPIEDRHKVFDWSNRMIGAEDPEFQVSEEEAGLAAAELFTYAQALAEEKRANPADDIVTRLLDVGAVREDGVAVPAGVHEVVRHETDGVGRTDRSASGDKYRD